MRASGILLPIASLPSEYGIGCFSKSAYDFIDTLKEAGQRFWQILPIGPTGYGDSPYQSFSTFAGNPYFIDFESLIKEGLLTQGECDSIDFGDDPRYIDYEKIYLSRFELLRKAYERSNIKTNEAFHKYCKLNAFWLDDYALYMAIKNEFEGISWSEWNDDIRLRTPSALIYYQKELSAQIDFFKYIQYVFANQWNKIKNYANRKGVQIIGDIPIYVAFDSADTWSHPELFQFDEDRIPLAVSGCPPDGFSATGQLWGNPLYEWDYHKKHDYQWWIQRISYSFQLFDVLRVDHFKGFDEYFSIPFGEETAENGTWKEGPGFDFFHTLKEKLGDLKIIAEDLGNLTNNTRALLAQTGYPGMKVLEFAFDSREESDYLPHNYEKNSIVYTGTHDNDTLRGWYENISEKDRELSKTYLNNHRSKENEIHWDFIRLAQQSVSKLCIIPLQDYLGLGSNARINIPSTVGNNWKWRMIPGDITVDLIKEIRKITKIYGRI